MFAIVWVTSYPDSGIYAVLKQRGIFMVASNNYAIVVGYPNQIGDCGRYELGDQRMYFSKFDGGASLIFELALCNAVSGDLIAYTEQCNELLDNYYQSRFEENTVSIEQYQHDRREFNRRIFDIYRYAKSSLSSLGENLGFSTVKRIATNRKFDSSKFLLK